ncbi:MAG: hypothetical protein GXP43_02845 [bacterium]|nr:hypothetical protein [bacterium]
MPFKIDPKNVDNQQIAWLLRAIAAAYTIKNGPYFKIVAYNNAADEIEHLTTPITYLWQQNRLDEIPNVGQHIKKHLDELFRTGQSKHFNRLLGDIHPAVFILIKVPGIGAKTADKLTKHFKFPKKSEEKIIKTLISLAKQAKIQQIAGFKAKSQERLAKLAAEYLADISPKRFLLSEALEVAEPFISFLQQHQDLIKEAVVLGSLRRRLPTVGDIDIAAKTNKPDQVVKLCSKYPFFKEYETAGSNKARIVLTNGYRIDLVTSPAFKFGSLLQHLTGSKFHNIALRERALEKGYSVSEHGIKDLRTKKLHHFDNEVDFYKFLGLQWIPPELRENKGEIELAERFKLPQLIDKNDVLGDFHIHSDFDISTSHDLGRSGLKDLVIKAKNLKYHFLAVTDHNPKKALASDQKAGLFKKRNRLIDKVSQQFDFCLFKSLEVDINPDGSLAIEKNLLDLFDFIIVAVHSRFDMSSSAMTDRIIKALAYPKVKILAHPTGRILNKRKGFEADWPKIFKVIKKRSQAIEINASPYRLDLPDDLVRLAVKTGVKMTIGTDAHADKDMDWMKFGVWNARRGWAGPDDIINTWSIEKLKKWLKK